MRVMFMKNTCVVNKYLPNSWYYFYICNAVNNDKLMSKISCLISQPLTHYLYLSNVYIQIYRKVF